MWKMLIKSFQPCFTRAILYGAHIFTHENMKDYTRKKKRSQSKEKLGQINVSKCTIEGLISETTETWKERQRR